MFCFILLGGVLAYGIMNTIFVVLFLRVWLTCIYRQVFLPWPRKCRSTRVETIRVVEDISVSFQAIQYRQLHNTYSTFIVQDEFALHESTSCHPGLACNPHHALVFYESTLCHPGRTWNTHHALVSFTSTSRTRRDSFGGQRTWCPPGYHRWGWQLPPSLPQVPPLGTSQGPENCWQRRRA